MKYIKLKKVDKLTAITIGKALLVAIITVPVFIILPELISNYKTVAFNYQVQNPWWILLVLFFVVGFIIEIIRKN